MDTQQIEEEEIKPLLFNYIFHALIFILIFIFHLIINLKITWTSMIFSKLFIFGTSFYPLYSIISVPPMYYILIKKFKIDKIRIIRKVSTILTIITIVVGLFSSMLILTNAIQSKKFFKECPFTVPVSHLNKVFGSYFGKSPDSKEIKDECKSRRCVMDSSNLNEEYPFKYLCNYDPTDEINNDDKTYTRTLPDGSEISKDKELICTPLVSTYVEISFVNNVIYDYLDLCYDLSDFFTCERLNKPDKIYDIKLELSCPDDMYIFVLYVFSALIITIDLIISSLPWIVEIIALKRIIRFLTTARIKANSHNSTAKSSVVSNKEDSFKKEDTFIIISPLGNEEIQQNNNNLSKSSKNRINIKSSNNPLILIQKGEEKKNVDDNNSERVELDGKEDGNTNSKSSKKVQAINLINVFSRNQNSVNTATDQQNPVIIKNLNIRSKTQFNSIKDNKDNE